MKRNKNDLRLPFPAGLALSVAVALVLLTLGVNGQAVASVRVKAEVTVEGDRIALRDVAEISAAPDAKTRLESLSLGYAPNIGMSRELTRSQIQMAVSAAGFKDARLEAPETVIVHRAGQSVSADAIRSAVERAVAEQLPADRIAVKSVRIDAPEGIRVPVGDVEIRAAIANVRNIFARFPAPVEIRVGGRIVRTLAVNVEIEASADVLVALHDLVPNAKITEADVRAERKRLVKPLTNYIFDPARLRGAVTTRAIPQSAEITTDSLVAGVVVKYGDQIRLEAASGSVKLVIAAEARSSGKIGDRISVKNPHSGAILQAFVIDEGLARVAF